MFEKMYAVVLRLFPARFRKEYEQEACQLMRDRFRDETGLLQRTRLCWDLLTDTLISLPREYRDRWRDAQPVAASIEGVPSFMVLEEQRLGRGLILLASAFSLATIFAFVLFLEWSMAHMPVLSQNGRTSSIEAVMERLNQPPNPDTAADLTEEARGFSLSSGLEPQPLPTAPAEQVSTGDSPQPPFPSTAISMVAWGGMLTDWDGRPVPSAEIYLRGEHSEQMARTKDDGAFTFAEVPPGNYRVAVILSGREITYRKQLYIGHGSNPGQLTLSTGGYLLIAHSK